MGHRQFTTDHSKSVSTAPARRATERSEGAPQARGPRAVTRGESTEPSGSDGVAVVDWLSFTFTGFDVHRVAQLVGGFFFTWLGQPVRGESGNGQYNYKKSVRWYADKNGQQVCIGSCAWDGNNGTCFVDLNGTGCSLVTDWESVRHACQAWNAKVTRLDLAVDCLHGEHTVDDALHWYTWGEFNRGGNQPKHSCAGAWIDPSQGGRTLYVGKRENGKQCCIYEKGKQLGDMLSSWVRFEIRWGSRDRIIPHDAITEPTKYFAGAYHWTERIVSVGAERIRTLRAEGELSLSHLMNSCKVAYGRLVYVARMVADDPLELLNDLAVTGAPRRLAKAFVNGLYHAVPPDPLPGAHHHGAV